MSRPSKFSVKWRDAHSPQPTKSVDMDDPNPLKGIHEPASIETIGWLLQSDAEGVTMSGEDAGENQFRSLTFIPRCLIKSEDPIKEPRKRRAGIAGRAKAPSPPSSVVESSTTSVSSVPIDGVLSSRPSEEEK